GRTPAPTLRTIPERLGVRGVALVDARVNPLEDPSHFERALTRMLEPYRAYLTQHVCFDDTTATRLLRAMRGRAPHALGRRGAPPRRPGTRRRRRGARGGFARHAT